MLRPLVDDRFAAGERVGIDVSGIEQTDLLQPADSALIAVGEQDRAAEATLVQPDLGLTNDVLALEASSIGTVSGSSKSPTSLPGVTGTRPVRGKSCVT